MAISASAKANIENLKRTIENIQRRKKAITTPSKTTTLKPEANLQATMPRLARKPTRKKLRNFVPRLHTGGKTANGFLESIFLVARTGPSFRRRILDGRKGGPGCGCVIIFGIIFFPFWLIYKIFKLIFCRR